MILGVSYKLYGAVKIYGNALYKRKNIGLYIYNYNSIHDITIYIRLDLYKNNRYIGTINSRAVTDLRINYLKNVRGLCNRYTGYESIGSVILFTYNFYIELIGGKLIINMLSGYCNIEGIPLLAKIE